VAALRFLSQRVDMRRMYSHVRTPRSLVLLCMLSSAFACKVHAQVAPPAAESAKPPAAAKCLPAGNGYLRARLSGTVSTELNWGNEGTECTGAVRPTDGGIRMRFSRPDGEGKLVLVFGIAQLREGKSAQNVPVNVTLIREGAGQFFSTQGDDKCTLDAVTQDAIVGIPHRSRSYQVTARGFCTQPARAVRGNGAVLLSRFDYSGRVDFESQDTQSEDVLTAGKQ
jgi:hypothetical protein